MPFVDYDRSVQIRSDRPAHASRKSIAGRKAAAFSRRITGPAAASNDVLLELDDALERLSGEFPVAAERIERRFSARMTLGEAARALGLPRRTADRQSAVARAWLADALA